MKSTHVPYLLNKIATAAALFALNAGVAYAENSAVDKSAPPAPPVQTVSTDKPASGLNLDEVVVTATAEAKPKMRQSVSVSSLNADQITDSGATNAAEILRSIPGVRAESSSGEGNANVTVRGVPISAGGSRYVQFQEDGLPILLFGDFNFVTPDMFIRADYGTDGLEVVRGGSASTLATNAAGGVINFISKLAEEPGGAIGISTNLGGGTKRRADFAYGLHLSDSSRLQLSGFVRGGEGARETRGENMEGGGQFRAAFYKDLGGGNSVKLFMKLLDDQTPTNLTVPVRIANGKIQTINGIDPRKFSPYDNRLPAINAWGVYDNQSGDIGNGLRSKSTSFGGEISLDAGGGWTVNNKFRIASNSGEFNGIMPNNYSGGGNPASTSLSSYNALFLGAHFNDLGLSVNDLKASKSFQLSDSTKLTSTLGLFAAHQKLDIAWEIGGIDASLPINDSTTYGAYSSFYAKSINVGYRSIAPYANLGLTSGAWDLDASVRFDRQSASGSYADTGASGLGTIPVDYNSSLTSYSVGANYRIAEDIAVFSRVSKGGSFQSDRLMPGTTDLGGNRLSFSNITVKPNTVNQYEVGLKARFGKLSTFATLFKADTDESNYDLTTGVSSQNKYSAHGLEVEAGYRLGSMNFSGGLTFTDADVKKSTNTAYIGKTPNRQAKLIYQLSSTYAVDALTLGATLIGTGKSRDAQTTAYEAELPAYQYVNVFGRYDVTSRLAVTLAVNNLFNKLGFTEVNGDRAAARSIDGRTVSLSARYTF